MNTKKSALTLAIGSAFAVSLAAPAVHAADNPFGMQALKGGYMLAQADMTKEGKAKEGNCGANKAEQKTKAAQEKAKKAKEGNCGAKKEEKK
jgi:uncharacterized low-complexity protein